MDAPSIFRLVTQTRAMTGPLKITGPLKQPLDEIDRARDGSSEQQEQEEDNPE
jgi:hypothetical protein